jgi:uracil-DNA glycosylase
MSAASALNDPDTFVAGLCAEIAACRRCAPSFAATATAHAPRPVVWFRPSARLLIAGQAPGLRVHEAGQPFADASGRRLRDWLGLSEDLPPPPICAATWRAQVMAALPRLRLVLAVGGAAQRWHLGARTGVTATVAGWREHAARGVWPLPHPSWRNTGWLRRHPWFEAEALPALRSKLREVLDDDAG